MTTTAPRHTDEGLQALADTLLADAQAGHTRATATELARRAGMPRPTLYRNHPALIHDFLTKAAEQRQASPPRQAVAAKAQDQIARLRQENAELRLHLAHYEDHLRRLAADNAKLRDQVESLGNVGDLAALRLRRAGQGAEWPVGSI